MKNYFKTLSTRNKFIFIIKCIAIIMLLIALLKNPHGYYVALRRTVVIISLYIIYEGIHNKKYTWIGIGIVSGILFNPIQTPHLTREIWSILNVLVAVEFGLSVYKLK